MHSDTNNGPHLKLLLNCILSADSFIINQVASCDYYSIDAYSITQLLVQTKLPFPKVDRQTNVPTALRRSAYYNRQ